MYADLLCTRGKRSLIVVGASVLTNEKICDIIHIGIVFMFVC